MASGRCDVLHLSWALPEIGGVERVIEGYLEAAREREGLVHRACFLSGRNSLLAERLVERGLAVRLGLEHGWDPAGPWRVARALRRLRPRIVVSHTSALAPTVWSLLASP